MCRHGVNDCGICRMEAAQADERANNLLRIVRGEAEVYDGEDEYDQAVHACTPFCPTCGERVTASGRLSFTGAHIDIEGWSEDGWEYETHDIEGYCWNCRSAVDVYFCYGETPRCPADENDALFAVKVDATTGEYVD